MQPTYQRYFIGSLILHCLIASIILLTYDFAIPRYVYQNSNEQDVINAIILGDSEKSKIMPKPLPEVKPEVPVAEKPKLAPVVVKKEMPAPPIKKSEVKPASEPIALKHVAAEKLKKQDLLAENLLAEIKKSIPPNKIAKAKPSKINDKFSKTFKEQAEKSLRQHLLEEEVRMQAEQERKSQGIINKYIALIQQTISEHWIVPPQSDRHLYCELLIKLASSGSVLDVTIQKSSGDKALDNSARAAVLKASPLPVPKGVELDRFKQFVLKVKPENVLGYKQQGSKNLIA